ncbi:hypothetical protein KIW84_070603 [Lathyrus oleraceus]|uniref:Uncharacterized protein n=1 Tax=Pisum sativum TaxID=3888 RepID=A0A9D4ZUS9_PEA|nr:hypothetical protein KIW84_070603 [Pisum sativum]
MMNCCHNVPDWSLPNVLLDSGIFPVHRKCWRNISDASIIPAAINCSSVASLEHDMSTPSRKLSFLKSISDEVSVELYRCVGHKNSSKGYMRARGWFCPIRTNNGCINSLTAWLLECIPAII